MRFAIILLLVFIKTGVCSAQPEYSGALMLTFPHLQDPTLDSDASLDAVIGYALANNIARTTKLPQFDSIVANLTNGELSRNILRYWYRMDDHDPIRFFQWAGSYGDGIPTKTPPGYAEISLVQKLEAISQDTGRALYLCYADIIAHVKVLSRDTMTTPGNHRALRRIAERVDAEVIDTIKGRVLPQSNLRAKAAKSIIPFEYRWNWAPAGIRGDFSTSDIELSTSFDSSWIRIGREYIVFLRFLNLGTHATNDYASLMPAFGATTMGGMYPIVNGKVQDPNDDFGFGSNLTSVQFKRALREKINTLINPIKH